MHKYVPVFSAALALVAVACASNPPPQATSPSTSDSTDKATEGDGAADGKWADGQRESFMTGCATKVKAPDYCSCGFDQFRQVFKDGPPAGSSDPRLKALGERTKAECASKLPEDLVKASFLRTCVSDDKRKTTYCECAWPALRKNLAVVDFTTDFEGPRFDAAKHSMAVACKGKFPTDIAKAEFLKGCTKEAPGQAKACECAWKKISAKFSTEEIVSGTADLQAAGVGECK
jgi:hypothetical protein